MAAAKSLTPAEIQQVLDHIASGKHYYIFDEVDNLSKTAQAGLKTTLNSQRGTFILTTNNISQLDKGVKDRCVLVEMNAATDAEYLALAAVLPQTKMSF
jgi:DNA polymerase III delta prime subunit